MLRHLISAVMVLAWGLWFGGLVTLLLVVETLFSVRRDIAPAVASTIFLTFERYQYVVGALAVLAAVTWALAPSPPRTAFAILLALTAVLAGVSTGFITPRLEALRLAQLADSASFRHLHVISVLLFTTNLILLLIAGVMLPATMRGLPAPPVPPTSHPA